MPKIPVNFYYGSSEYLNTIPISEGNILYNVTNHQMLVDEDSSRLCYSDKTVVDTKLNDKSNNPISNSVVSAEINALKTKQKTLETDLTKKGTENTTSSDDLKPLQTDLESLQADLKSLKSEVNEQFTDLGKRTSTVEDNVTTINKAIATIGERDEIIGKSTQCGTCNGQTIYKLYLEKSYNNIESGETLEVELSDMPKNALVMRADVFLDIGGTRYPLPCYTNKDGFLQAYIVGFDTPRKVMWIKIADNENLENFTVCIDLEYRI